MLKIFSLHLITRCKQFSIGSIQILSRFSIGRYNPSSYSRKCPFGEFRLRDLQMKEQWMRLLLRKRIHPINETIITK